MNLFEAVSYTCVSLKFYLPSSSVVSPSALRQEVSGSNLPCSLFFFQTPLHSNLGLHNTAAIRNGQISQRLSLRLDLGLPNRCRSATPPFRLNSIWVCTHRGRAEPHCGPQRLKNITNDKGLLQTEADRLHKFISSDNSVVDQV